MELYQLKVFLEVARHLSFTEAADSMHLTQPAVSAKIKALESELDVSLFYRLGRKIQLTDIGHCLVEEGSRLIAFEQQVIDRIQELKAGKGSNLRVGCTSVVADDWLPNLLYRYRSQYPKVATQTIVFDSTELLYRAIVDETIDLGFSDIEFRGFSEILTTEVDRITYGLMVNINHPFSASIWPRLQDTLKEPWVILSEGSPSRLVFESRLTELGLTLSDFRQLEVVDSLNLMRTYILQGGAIGFGSSLEFVLERQVQMMTLVPLQEFALDANLYLIQPRRLAVASAKSDTDFPHGITETAQLFIQLLLSTQPPIISPPLPPENHPHPITPPQPIRLRSPAFGLRSHTNPITDVLKIGIGTQNSTIHSATAGLVIRQLGLLEHFLPREGRYSTTRFQIEWQDFTSGSPIVQSLQSEQLDFGVLGDYPLLLAAMGSSGSHQPATQLVSFVSINPDGRGNAVIVPQESRLGSIEDLSGRTIAVPWESSAHGMIIRVLSDADLLSKVNLTTLDNLTLHLAEHSYTDNVVDGYGHFAPFWTIASRQRQFRRLFDGYATGLPAFYGVVVRSSFAQKHPDIVVAYLRALRAAQYWYISTPDAPELIGKWLNIDSHIVAHIMSQTFSYDQPGLFMQDITLRQDWLQEHINALQNIPGNESLDEINLNSWIHSDFMDISNRSL
jgi:NitT/TauT family transport system substrate-binding protein